MGICGSSVRHAGTAAAKAFGALLKHETPRDAAAISYFSLLALFPAALVLIAIVDAFLGWFELHNLMVQKITSMFPGSRAFLRTNLTEFTDPSPAFLLCCLGVVVWSSTWILDFVEDGLNRAWGVRKQRSFWESRVRSIGLMVLAGLLLLASTGVTGIVSAAQSRATALAGGKVQAHFISWMWSSILLGSGLVIAILVFSLIYKLMPDRRVPWHEAISGAVAAAVLWEIGSYIFARLVPFFDYQRVYGKMGAIIALLTWVYTSSLITLYGANFSAQLQRPHIQQPDLLERPARRARERKNRGAKIRAFPHQN
jgi:membrane protein